MPVKIFNTLYYLWVFLRNKNRWVAQIRDFHFGRPMKTVETFLPPITSKVTEFPTIHKYLSYLQSLANSVNMLYVNVTLAINARQSGTILVFIKMVIIHLGSFHFLKENFKV